MRIQEILSAHSGNPKCAFRKSQVRTQKIPSAHSVKSAFANAAIKSAILQGFLLILHRFSFFLATFAAGKSEEEPDNLHTRRREIILYTY